MRSIRAILAGSKPGPQWEDKIKRHLGALGVQVIETWTMPVDARRAAGIAEAEIVLVTIDCASHELWALAKASARPRQIPVVGISHRLSDLQKTVGRIKGQRGEQ